MRCRLSKEREVVPLDGIVDRACSCFVDPEEVMVTGGLHSPGFFAVGNCIG